MARLKLLLQLQSLSSVQRLADRIRDGAIETSHTGRTGRRSTGWLADRIRDGAIETNLVRRLKQRLQLG